MTFSELAAKKVVGVPVLYLAGAFVAVLAVVAWRMKPSTPDTDSEFAETEDAVLDENGIADGKNPYAGMATNGTVIVQPAPPAEAPEPDGIDTNDEWIRKGAAWLVAEKGVSGPAAFTALSKYVNGQSRSLTEGQWVEAVFKQFGAPPDAFQETPLPAPTTPTTPTPTVPKPTIPVATGYRGYGWYKTPGGLTGAQIAAKYKISTTMFYTWNPRLPRVPAKGTWCKVRANSNPLTGYKGV